MTDISMLSQRLATPTLHFVLLTIATFGVWPLLWLYKKQDIISDTAGYPLYGNLFIIWLTVCFGLSRQLGVMATPDPYGDDSTGDILLAFSGLLSVVSGVMYVVWAFKARTALRHYALNTFRVDLKMNAFCTVLFNVFYITYCINDMPQALAKHQIIHGTAATSNGSAPAQTEPSNQP